MSTVVLQTNYFGWLRLVLLIHHSAHRVRLPLQAMLALSNIGGDGRALGMLYSGRC
jgi:hypothetical protein